MFGWGAECYTCHYVSDSSAIREQAMNRRAPSGVPGRRVCEAHPVERREVRQPRGGKASGAFEAACSRSNAALSSADSGGMPWGWL